LADKVGIGFAVNVVDIVDPCGKKLPLKQEIPGIECGQAFKPDHEV